MSNWNVQVEIDWVADPANDTATYRAFLDGIFVAEFPAVVNGATPYTYIIPPDALSHALRVSAKDAVGNESALSPALTWTAPDLTPPPVPGAPRFIAATLVP